MLTRRRFLSISAAAAALPAEAVGAPSVATHRWRGVALGAGASVILQGEDEGAAQSATAAIVAEIARLEREFSLYRSDSALVTLNRTGRLDAPSADMLRLLTLARSVHEATGGVFDPTVQPLWRALAEGRDDAETLAKTNDLVGFDRVDISESRIRFAAPDMALTLNGIAQGYITDSVARMLRARGFRNVLVDIGEIAAIGPRADGTDWPVKVMSRRSPGLATRHFRLRDRAIATSEPMASVLDARAGIGHILRPGRDCQGSNRNLVSVAGKSAALADALSTAFSTMTEAEIQMARTQFSSTPLVCVRWGVDRQ